MDIWGFLKALHLKPHVREVALMQVVAGDVEVEHPAVAELKTVVNVCYGVH